MRKATVKRKIAVILTVAACLFAQVFQTAALLPDLADPGTSHTVEETTPNTPPPDDTSGTGESSLPEPETGSSGENEEETPPITEIPPQDVPLDPGPSGEIPGTEIPAGQQESGAQAGYSKAALKKLLLSLAEERGEDRTELIEWLIEDAPLVSDALESIYSLLMKNPEEAGSFFEATEELYNELKDEKKESDVESSVNDDLDDILAAAQKMEESLEEPRAPVKSNAFIGPLQRQEALAAAPVKKTTISNDPYVKGLSKEVWPELNAAGKEIYRHYSVKVGADISIPSAGCVTGDIVLLLDVSDSIGKSGLNSIKTAVRYFLNQPAVLNGDSKINIVTFSDDTNIMFPEFLPASVNGANGKVANPEIIDALFSLDNDNRSNIQVGIVGARRAFEMIDGDIYDSKETDRSRSVVLFTDGGANRRYTDIWQVAYVVDADTGKGKYEYTITPQSGEEAEQDTKRWTYLVHEKTSDYPYVSGTRITQGSTDIDNSLLAIYNARLEAQYLGSQNIDIYTVNYTSVVSNQQYLELFTYRMTNQVSFKGDITTAPFEGTLKTVKSYEGKRSFNASDPAAIDKLIESLTSGAVQKKISFTITDELGEKFELVPGSGFTVTDGSGKDLTGETGWDDIKIKDGVITFNTPELSDTGTYYLTYHIRVKDDPSKPFIYYPDGEVTGTSSRTVLSYHNGSAAVSHDYDQPTTDVPPLLLISADDNIVGFVGEPIKLMGEINRGNGDYTYRWLAGDKTEVLQGSAIDFTGYAGETTGRDLEIPVPGFDCTLMQPGQYTYYLEVTDTRAYGAGYSDGPSGEIMYSGGKIIIEIKVTVLGGRLTVNVVGAGGEEIAGQFETTIYKIEKDSGGKDNVTGRFHFMGLGKREYDSDNGLTAGTYSVAVYTPYGYRVANDGSPRTVEIKPEQDAMGNWIESERTVTVTVEYVNMPFFFDWAWWPWQ